VLGDRRVEATPVGSAHAVKSVQQHPTRTSVESRTMMGSVRASSPRC